MKFDAPTLARGWLAVAAAASTNRDDLNLYKTTHLEVHAGGIRVTATDRRVLLTAWVPDLGNHYGSEPPIEIGPDRTLLAHDPDGRARSMLGHLLSLANRIPSDEYAPGQVAVTLDLDVRLPAGTAGTQDTLEGMDPTYAVLTCPAVEKVYLEAFPADRFPDWRPMAYTHTRGKAGTVHLETEVVERLAKTRKHTGTALAWSPGPTPADAAQVRFPDSDPHVHGFVMPAPEETWADDPAAVTEPTTDTPECEICQAPTRDKGSHGTIMCTSCQDPDQTTLEDHIEPTDLGALQQTGRPWR